jgi:hypothetical protein
MESATFRRWLIEHGCRIEARSHARHKQLGAATVIVQREGRKAELPLVGSRKRLDPDVVHAIVDQLGLDRGELPAEKSRA